VTDAGAPQEGADPASVAYQRAIMLAEVGHFEEALAVVEEALGEFPDDLRLRGAEASILLNLGRTREGRDILLELIGEQPEWAWAYLQLSVAEVVLDDLAAARTAADRALQIEPNQAKYHVQVAALAATGTISKADRALALERAASALELEPDVPDTLLSIAKIHRALGDTDAAKAFVARGLAIAPDDQDLHYFNAVLAGDYTKTTTYDYNGIFHLANQVGAMGDVLGMSPGNVDANQVLYGRVWGQLLRLVDAPLVAIAIVAISVGYFMGTGPTLNLLYVGAGFAAAIPLFRVVTTWAVLRRAPKGYLRRMVRGGRDAGARLGTTWFAVGAGVVGIVGLVFLREASLVRFLLLLLAVGAIAGGIGAVLWTKRYLDEAVEAGFFTATTRGFRTVKITRKGANTRFGWRCFVVLVAGVPAAMILNMTRADASPVLLIAMVAWAAPAVYELWRLRRISLQLAEDVDAPDGVTPSLIGGPLMVFATLLLAATAVFAIVRAPWAPSDRDAAGVYVQTATTGTSECTGRPASRLGCILRENEERMDELIEDMEGIEVPEIPDFEVPEIVVPTLPPVPEVVAP
jgi:hypothetical protein